MFVNIDKNKKIAKTSFSLNIFFLNLHPLYFGNIFQNTFDFIVKRVQFENKNSYLLTVIVVI